MPKDFQGFTETPAVVVSEAAGGKKVASNADSSKKRYTGLEEFRHVERSEADAGANKSKKSGGY